MQVYIQFYLISQILRIFADASIYNCTYGYFYLTFRHPTATEMVFHRIRSFYPDAKIYIHMDEGTVYFTSLELIQLMIFTLRWDRHVSSM